MNIPDGARLERHRVFTLPLLGLLGFIGILGPLGTDAFAPALPSIAEDLREAPALVQATFSVFGLGMALGQLAFGPLSDRYGRKVFLLSGTAMMMIGALVASVSQNASLLFIACFTMGLGGSVSVVVVWALISDRLRGAEAARAFSIVDAFVAFGPIIGPLAGVLLLNLGGWRSIFLGVGLFAGVALLLIALFIPETRSASMRQSSSWVMIFAGFRTVFGDRNFLLRLVSLVASFGVLFTYIGASPFLLMRVFELDTSAYAMVFAGNGLGLILASFCSAKLSRKVRIDVLMGFGVSLSLASGLSLLLALLVFSAPLWTILVILFALISSIGFISGPGTAMALSHVGQHSGTALAVIGAFQFLVGGLAITAVGFGRVGLAFSASVVALALISMTFWVFGQREAQKSALRSTRL